jgi:predicted transcriptional regulator
VSTVAVRIPDDIHADVKTVAAMRGKTPGTMLAQAWLEFTERHRDEISADFESVTRMFREGDREGLAELSRQTRRERAEVAAAAARNAS